MLLTCSEYMGKEQLETGLSRESSMQFWKGFLLNYGSITSADDADLVLFTCQLSNTLTILAWFSLAALFSDCSWGSVWPIKH